MIGAILLLGAALVVGYQIVLWLKDGFWTPMPLDLALRWLSIDSMALVKTIQWEGAKKICIWIFALPLAVGLSALAIAQFFAFDWLGNVVAGDRPQKPT